MLKVRSIKSFADKPWSLIWNSEGRSQLWMCSRVIHQTQMQAASPTSGTRFFWAIFHDVLLMWELALIENSLCSRWVMIRVGWKFRKVSSHRAASHQCHQCHCFCQNPDDFACVIAFALFCSNRGHKVKRKYAHSAFALQLLYFSSHLAAKTHVQTSR